MQMAKQLFHDPLQDLAGTGSFDPLLSDTDLKHGFSQDLSGKVRAFFAFYLGDDFARPAILIVGDCCRPPQQVAAPQKVYKTLSAKTETRPPNHIAKGYKQSTCGSISLTLV